MRTATYFWKTTMISRDPFLSLQKSRRRSSWLGPVSVLVALALLCVAVVLFQKQLSSVFWQIGAPLTRARNALAGSEAAALQAQLASTSAALADRDALYAQNMELKKMLGRPQTSSRVLAGVLQHPPATPYDTVLIDSGAANGVAQGDLVFAGGNAAIGEVDQAYTTTSRVSLFSAPGRTYDAQVSPAAAPGTVIPLSLAGQGAGSFAGEVPAGSVAIVGDPVVLPGLGNELLGSIARIDAPSGSSFETLYVQLPVSIFSLQYVQVQTHL